MALIKVEPYVPDEDYDNPAMVTDFYEFTMANAMFELGYKDTVMVSGEACTTILIHTLTIVRHEDIDLVGEPDARGAQKVIIRDRMYIILNDEWYTPAGQKVADPRQ